MSKTESVRVRRLEEVATRHGSARVRYSIQVRRVPPIGSELEYFSVTTLDSFKASLCQRAKELGVPIELTWRRSKYWDQDLVSVSMPETASTA